MPAINVCKNIGLISNTHNNDDNDGDGDRNKKEENKRRKEGDRERIKRRGTKAAHQDFLFLFQNFSPHA